MELMLRARIRAGDLDAFGMLFDDYARAVYNLAFRLTGDWPVAQAAVSLTFLEAWRLRSRVAPAGSSLRPWLLGVAVQVTGNLGGTARRHRAALSQLPGPAPVPDLAGELAGQLDDSAAWRWIAAPLAALAPAEREVAALCAWCGLDETEAASALGVSAGTVVSRLARAHRQLRAAGAGRSPAGPPGSMVAGLARLLPVPAERELPSGRASLLKEHLMTQLRGGQGSGRAARFRRGPGLARLGERRWLAGAAAAAGAAGLATAVAAVSVSVLGQPPPPGPTVTSVLTDAVGHLNAVQLLISVANAAGRPQPVIVASGQFAYFEGMVSFGAKGGPAPAQTHLQQVWRPATDLCAGGLVIEYGQRYSLTVRRKCPDHGRLQANPTYPLLRSLPTDPRALLATLRKVRFPGVPADEAAFSTIGNIQESVVPPDVSAALYRAAALMPEVTAGPSAYDPIGRPGLTVSFILGGAEEQWIFDPDTLRLLGEAGFSNGVTTSESAILDRAIVDRAGELPPGG